MSELEEFCRTCMSKLATKPKGNIDNFGIFNQPNLANKLMHCSRLPVHPSDEYPHSLCAKCYEKIVDFYEFQRMCRDSLRTFKEILMIGKHVSPENDIDTVGQLHTSVLKNSDGINTNLNYDTKAANQCKKTKHCDYVLDDSLNDNQLIEFSMDTFMLDNEKFGIDCSSSSSVIEEPLDETHYTKRQDSNKAGIVISTTKARNRVHNKGKSEAKGAVEILPTPLPSDNVAKCSNKSAENTGKVSCDLKTSQRALTTNSTNNGHIENSNYGIKTSEIKKLGSSKTTMTNTKMVGDPTKNIPDNVDVQHIIKSPVDDTNYDMDTSPIRDALSEKISDYEEEYLIETTSENEQIVSVPYNNNSFNKPHSKLPFHCDRCPKLFKFKHRLVAHKRRHRGLSGYHCSRKNCQHSFNNLNDLKIHLNSHDGILREVYKCDLNNCGKEYTTKEAINLHLRKQHNFGPVSPDNRYVCETCGAVLKSGRSLHEHLYIHMDKSLWPFHCDIEGCSSRFRNINQLKEHKDRHAGIRRYACPHCDKRFGSSSNLSTHINYHTLEKKWSCQFCPKVCYTPANLRLHIQNHHEHNPKSSRHLPCRFCSKKLSSSAARKYHEMIHTGEKPFVCDECGRGFTQSGALKKHKLTHTIEGTPKVFNCRLCERTFTSANSQKNHELKHTGEKPYECPQCGVKFRYPSNLMRHKRQRLCTKASIVSDEKDQTKLDSLVMSLV